MCATVVEPLANLDRWGVPNVLCVLLHQLAPVEIYTEVLGPPLPQDGADTIRAVLLDDLPRVLVENLK